MSKQQKIAWLTEHYFAGDETVADDLIALEVKDPALQHRIDQFIENTITNCPLPLGVAPNLLLNGKVYAVPMAIEESSVVAAASAAMKFWLPLGGFHAEVKQMHKVGQVHFNWSGKADDFKAFLPELKAFILENTKDITANMRKRGGGVLDVQLRDFTEIEPFYFQLLVTFDTADSMGANFINTVLEAIGHLLPQFLATRSELSHNDRNCEIIMAILSNYTPNCVVKAWVECPIEHIGILPDKDAVLMARKFAQAVRIARMDPYRAVTHNKGIFNGIDAVALATGQDFRAIEACAHAYAGRDGQYRSLSVCTIENGLFRFELEVPLALGVVGGLTKLHLSAKRSIELLGNPDAKTLMMIIAATGLAQNFAAVRSLITTGIQKGHMKMHLKNIIMQLGANASEEQLLCAHFADKSISFAGVREHLATMREKV